MSQFRLRKSLLAVSIGLVFAAHAQAALRGQSDAISRLSANAGSTVQVSLHGATGAARFVRAAPGVKLLSATAARGASTDATRQATAQQFLIDYADLFGIADPSAELVVGRSSRDGLGNSHVAYEQVYKGVPVFGAELKAHFDATGNLTVVNGAFVPGLALKTTPVRTASQAASVALARVQSELRFKPKVAPTASTPTLVIYRDGLAKGVEGTNYLAWKVEVGNRTDVRDFVFVDAITGKVIEKIRGIHEAKKRRAFDAASQVTPGSNYPNNPFWVEGQAFPTGNTEADNMIAASSEIYDLFRTAFGRDSYDANGAQMDAIFNRGDSCPNASWNGSLISFCAGTTTDDITAHEWGHAYTEYTHALIYAWQPGALNEAYSDIWGETVDRLNGRGGDTPDAARTAEACTSSATVDQLNILAPAAIAGVKSVGTAAFGPQSFSLSANDVVVVNDGAGSSASDACETPFVNASAVAGKIAYVDRGNCAFVLKAKNAQLNGAVGLIVGNDRAGTVGMSGTDASVVMPTLSVSQADGAAIKAQTGVRASMLRGPGTDVSVRWLIGEDSSAFGGAIRDMYNPVCYGNPGKVSDAQYVCLESDDSGGVHSNSGVPNHGYALLVDGGRYNGQTVTAIGLTKAAHIYYRAQSVYQGPSSGFADHADALAQSCVDLTGRNLADLKTGAPSGQVITAADCGEVAKTALAIELRTSPAQCFFQPLLAQSPPALCAAGTTVNSLASDSFDGGKRGGLKWLVSKSTLTTHFQAADWGVVSSLPGGRSGYGIFVGDPNIGECTATSDATSLQRLESPEVTIPAGTTTPRLSFDHWVATESTYDGGNVKISVNGGEWKLLKGTDFIYNPYNDTLLTTNNSNPLAGQAAFTGSDGGSVSGSWGRSIVNLAPYAVAGDRIKLRFEFGKDCGGGMFGWYLDDVNVYRCTP